ncbi:MAG: glycosyltransferase [Gemmataceae bacterium]
MKKVLAIFAKCPKPGATKTRLFPDTLELGARVAEAFLLDTLERMSTLQVERKLFYAPAESRDLFERLAGSVCQLEPQSPGDLGARLSAFFRQYLTGARAACVAIGTDSPTLPVEYVAQAFATLARRDVVLGPTADGGFYLLGLARFHKDLLSHIAWGTEHVLGQIASRIGSLGMKLSLLPVWYDVDTQSSWQMLAGHLTALACAGDILPRHTAHLVVELSKSRQIYPGAGPSHAD